MNLTVLVTSLTVEKAPACANALNLLLSDVKQMHKKYWLEVACTSR